MTPSTTRTAPSGAGLYAAKGWFTRRLAGVVRWAVRHRVSPDVFTLAGVVCAAVAGLAVAGGWWPVALVALVGRLAGANLDGAVARAQGAPRPFGFVLNEIGDRASDLLAMAGLVALAWRVSTPAVALLAAAATVAATLPTSAALAAAGAGAPRVNGGPFGKTERCAALFAACLAGAVLDDPTPALVAVCWAVLVGSAVTAVLRLRTAHGVLRTGST